MSFLFPSLVGGGGPLYLILTGCLFLAHHHISQLSISLFAIWLVLWQCRGTVQPSIHLTYEQLADYLPEIFRKFRDACCLFLAFSGGICAMIWHTSYVRRQPWRWRSQFPVLSDIMNAQTGAIISMYNNQSAAVRSPTMVVFSALKRWAHLEKLAWRGGGA